MERCIVEVKTDASISQLIIVQINLWKKTNANKHVQAYVCKLTSTNWCVQTNMYNANCAHKITQADMCKQIVQPG
jgi:hypothetical protein